MAIDPHTMRRVRRAYVIILGTIWMPAIDCSLEIKLSDYDLENIGEFTRDNVEQWLTSHSGDFQHIIDFTAMCGDIEIEWSSEDNEMKYYDTLPSDD